MSIPQSFLQNVLDRSDIVDIIGSRVPIKKKGSSYFGCCPFHQEKSASFHVSPQKQFYYCFGCGAHGNVISFLREYDGLDFVEAVEHLARVLGLTVPREQGPRQVIELKPELEALYDVLEKANRFYQWNLRHHPAAGEVVDYLKKRQVSGKTAKKFELGFASDAWDGLLKGIGVTAVEVEALIGAGLVIQNDRDRQYDRFRHRLMFPIRNRKGKTVGFGGRVLSSEEEPKYLNSPETEVFYKGSLLYGLYELRQERFSENFVLVVEGYMDVVMLSEYGILNAVATLGTAATAEHMKQLFRQSDHLIFCFDGDRAGQEAAKRAAKVILPFMHSAHRSARFLFLPFEDDPDSYVRQHGREAFLKAAENAKPLLDFMWEILTSGLDLNLLGDRAQCVERSLGVCRLLPEGVYRTMLLNQLSEGSRFTLDQILQALEAHEKKEQTEKGSFVQAQKQVVSHDPLVLRAIQALCNTPEFVHRVEPFALSGTSTDLCLFRELLEVCRHFEKPTFPMILESVDRAYLNRLVEIAGQDIHIQVDVEEFLELCHKLQKRDTDHQLKELIEKSRQEDLSAKEKLFLKEVLSKKRPIKSSK